MAAKLQALIAEADQWRADHARRGCRIEAAACAIRIKALRDALALIAQEADNGR